jgi:hypothetical protein
MLTAISHASSQMDLKEYAKQRSLQWQSQRAYAESVAILKHMPIRTESEDGRVIELQRFYRGRPQYYTTCNFNAARTISTNKVWPGGVGGYDLTGTGVTLGEWDGGRVRATHQEFSGRVTSTQGSLADHATHVAGTMIAAGVVGAARGMSYQASLNAFDWNSDESEMATQASLGLRVSNHSYSYLTGWDYNTLGDGKWVWYGDVNVSTVEDYSFGFYDDHAREWDDIAHNAPYYLIVAAAANDRGDYPGGTVQHWVWVSGSWVLQTVPRNRDGNNDGYDCITSPGVAKNIMTVGAVNAILGGYTKPSDVVMSTFSNWGPTDDGRIKPDIVADGIDLLSSVSTADNGYGRMSGTSMASPNATGSVGLLLQRQKMMHDATPLLSSTLKAIIINTADEAGSNPGPDYSFGWGLMNTLKAVQIMTQDSINGFGSHIKELVLHQGETIQFDIGTEGVGALRATICWNDFPGTVLPPALDPTNSMLVNDVDLRIIKKINQEIYSPWILNPTSPSTAATTGDNYRDNVEQVHIESPERTIYTVRITHKGTLVGGSQYVSLAISGNTIGSAAAWSTQHFEIDVDSGAVKLDSFKLYDVGPATLEFSINDTGKTLPPWLSVNNNTGSVAQLDSLSIILTFGNLTQPVGDYDTTLSIESNDTITGTINIPIIVHIGIRRTLTTHVNDFWNIVSLPVDPFTNLSASLYPTTVGKPFAYDGFGYIEKDELKIGEGYWMKFNGEQNIPIEGYIFKSNTSEALLDPGWHLIGALSNSIPIEGVSTDPPDIINSFFFGYRGSYIFADSLHPGRGYWIQINQPGKITLTGTYPPLPKPTATKILSGFNTITISDGINNSQSLYFGSGGLQGFTPSFFKLPPKPPKSSFDVRFGSGRMLEWFGNIPNEKSEYPIYIQTESSPIKICWNMKSEETRKFVIRDESGKIYPLDKNGSFVLNGETSEIRVLTLASEPPQIPKDFVLQQNYPNPFNPTTKLKYGLPNAGYVNIIIYNILGNEVATLVDGMKEAGFYTIEFDASNFPSGLYFYRMKSEKFTAVKKMILMR